MPSSIQHWLLPEGVREILPDDAEALEHLRRKVLDLYRLHGYELVIPPMIEYLDSLLTGTAHDLNLKTFTLTDQLSGRLLGIRADMTPQVARMDAHSLKGKGINRLCYSGPVLFTRPEGLTGSRSPLQIGAELFGHSGSASDIEIICLLLETLKQAGLEQISLDLGHVGVFRSLVQKVGLSEQQEQQLFDMLQRKSVPEIETFLRSLSVATELRQQFCHLAQWNGDPAVLQEAREEMPAIEAVIEALDHLQAVLEAVQQRYPQVGLHIDLAELRGYHYHTGLVFAAYLPGQGTEIARGGRYDEIGAIFGEARSATGFSADLMTLFQLGRRQPDETAMILAPPGQQVALQQKIAALRDQGQVVVQQLDDNDRPGRRIKGHLQQQGETWEVVEQSE